MFNIKWRLVSFLMFVFVWNLLFFFSSDLCWFYSLCMAICFPVDFVMRVDMTFLKVEISAPGGLLPVWFCWSVRSLSLMMKILLSTNSRFSSTFLYFTECGLVLWCFTGSDMWVTLICNDFFLQPFVMCQIFRHIFRGAVMWVWPNSKGRWLETHGITR